MTLDPNPASLLTGSQGHQLQPLSPRVPAAPFEPVSPVGGEHLVPAVFPWFPQKIKITLKAAWHLPAFRLRAQAGAAEWRTQLPSWSQETKHSVLSASPACTLGWSTLVSGDCESCQGRAAFPEGRGLRENSSELEWVVDFPDHPKGPHRLQQDLPK